jgi:hypothetical protein
MDTNATKAPLGGVKEKQEPRKMVDRASRREMRIPFRYRRPGQEDWSPGETVNVSESGLLFSSNELLDVDTRLEITFQTSGAVILERSTRGAAVVRRILSNWPETQLLFGARFVS